MIINFRYFRFVANLTKGKYSRNLMPAIGFLGPVPQSPDKAPNKFIFKTFHPDATLFGVKIFQIEWNLKKLFRRWQSWRNFLNNSGGVYQVMKIETALILIQIFRKHPDPCDRAHQYVLYWRWRGKTYVRKLAMRRQRKVEEPTDV